MGAFSGSIFESAGPDTGTGTGTVTTSVECVGAWDSREREDQCDMLERQYLAALDVMSFWNGQARKTKDLAVWRKYVEFANRAKATARRINDTRTRCCPGII